VNLFEDIKTLREDAGSPFRVKQKKILTGISFLDEPLNGIMPTDFIVIGAATGLGKTQLSTIIGHNCALNGIKTVFFPLEAYHGEIGDRCKFPLIKDRYFKETGKTIDFKDWATGQLVNTEVEGVDKKVCEFFEKDVNKNLIIKYRKENEYYIENFEKDLEDILGIKDLDLILVDHLHYFNILDTESENRGIKRIINKMRDISLFKKIPVILISHLRKRDKTNKTIVPMIEEFHGSSEITKNPTQVITMSHAFDVEQPDKHLFPTHFHIAKDRYNGSLNRYVITPLYNIFTCNYETKYKLYKLTKGGTDIEEIMKKDLPNWALSVNAIGEYEKKWNQKNSTV